MLEMIRISAECLGIIAFSLSIMFVGALVISLPIIYIVKGF